MTCGSERISSGEPSAILQPWSRTTIRLTEVHDDLHVVLDEQDPDALPQPGESIHELSGFFVAQARGRFVQKEQTGLEGEGTGDLETLLNAQGKVFGQLFRIRT